MCTACGLANDIEVRLKLARTDADVAGDVVRTLELRVGIPDTVQAVVHRGYVTLTGKVSWIAQKRNAEKAVAHVRGVHGVFNHLDVVPDETHRDVRRRIGEALHMNADLDARHISIAITGDVVVLTGTVGSWLQREAAERAAGDAPGIRWVDDRITIEPAVRREELDMP